MTGSDGVIRGAIGGHPDTADGAEIAIVVAPLIRGRIPTIVKKVNTIVTPGSTIDVVVTDQGIAVNPVRTDLIKRLSEAGLPVCQEQLSGKCLSPCDMLEIRFRVRNTGNVPGTEVVQLYVSDCYASVCRPVQELAGFARVELRPGEEKTVQFCLELSQLAFLDEKMRWKIEAGEVEICVGGSSEDIRLKEIMTITDDAYIEGRNRAFWAEASVF